MWEALQKKRVPKRASSAVHEGSLVECDVCEKYFRRRDYLGKHLVLFKKGFLLYCDDEEPHVLFQALMAAAAGLPDVPSFGFHPPNYSFSPLTQFTFHSVDCSLSPARRSFSPLAYADMAGGSPTTSSQSEPRILPH